jgi:hypothetical protein
LIEKLKTLTTTKEYKINEVVEYYIINRSDLKYYINLFRNNNGIKCAICRAVLPFKELEY